MKTLVGTWTSKPSDELKAEAKKEHGEDLPEEVSVTFKLTGAGSALVETQFPGMPHEMVSVYHLDGKELRMTHYCAAGNQPRVKLDRAKSTPDELIFVFDGGTNLDPEKDMHIHGVKIKFGKDGKVTSAWDGYVGGKKASTTTFNMTRKFKRERSSQAPTDALTEADGDSQRYSSRCLHSSIPGCHGSIATSPGPTSSAYSETEGLASSIPVGCDRMESISGRSGDRSRGSDLADRCVRDPPVREEHKRGF